MTPGSVVGSVVLAALVVVFGVITINVGTGNWQIQPILSGSMSPGFPVGGVVVAQRVPTASLQVRDVILFHPPGEPTKTFVHRIVSLKEVAGTDVIRTQGDANLVPDPWTLLLKGKWAYEARYTVPLVGYVAVWDHSTRGRQELLFAAGALIVLSGGLLAASQMLAYRRGKIGTSVPAGEPPEGAVQDDAPAPPTTNLSWGADRERLHTASPTGPLTAPAGPQGWREDIDGGGWR